MRFTSSSLPMTRYSIFCISFKCSEWMANITTFSTFKSFAMQWNERIYLPLAFDVSFKAIVFSFFPPLFRETRIFREHRRLYNIRELRWNCSVVIEIESKSTTDIRFYSSRTFGRAKETARQTDLIEKVFVAICLSVCRFSFSVPFTSAAHLDDVSTKCGLHCTCAEIRIRSASQFQIDKL